MSHPDRNPAPPTETGRRLATYPRGPNGEVRVTLAEYEGHPYIGIRLWEAGVGGFWPTKKGISIRMGEAPALARVLAAVAREEAPTARVTPAERRPGAGRGWKEAGLPPFSGGEGFDECDV